MTGSAKVWTEREWRRKLKKKTANKHIFFSPGFCCIASKWFNYDGWGARWPVKKRAKRNQFPLFSCRTTVISAQKTSIVKVNQTPIKYNPEGTVYRQLSHEVHKIAFCCFLQRVGDCFLSSFFGEWARVSPLLKQSQPYLYTIQLTGSGIGE